MSSISSTPLFDAAVKGPTGLTPRQVFREALYRWSYGVVPRALRKFPVDNVTYCLDGLTDPGTYWDSWDRLSTRDHRHVLAIASHSDIIGFLEGTAL